MVDVGVGDDDLLDGEVMLAQQGDDTRDLVTGGDDDGFAGGLVSEDGAVALEEADGEDFVEHSPILLGRVIACLKLPKTWLFKQVMRRRFRDRGHNQCLFLAAHTTAKARSRLSVPLVLG